MCLVRNGHVSQIPQKMVTREVKLPCLDPLGPSLALV